jgi:hypothetical protein
LTRRRERVAAFIGHPEGGHAMRRQSALVTRSALAIALLAAFTKQELRDVWLAED